MASRKYRTSGRFNAMAACDHTFLAAQNTSASSWQRLAEFALAAVLGEEIHMQLAWIRQRMDFR